MPISFLDLPGEIRNEIYKHCLVRDEPISPWKIAEYGLSLEILYLNSQIHHEAVYMLYALNSFNLTRFRDRQWEYIQVPWFLNKIGSKNASLLRSIEINLPRVSYAGMETRVWDTGMSIEDCIDVVLHSLHEGCPGLEIIKMPFSSVGLWAEPVRFTLLCVFVLAIPRGPCPYVASGDSQSRRNSNIVFVETLGYVFCASAWTKTVMAHMRNYGWTLAAMEETEEESLPYESLGESDESLYESEESLDEYDESVYESDEGQLEYDEGEDTQESESDM